MKRKFVFAVTSFVLVCILFVLTGCNDTNKTGLENKTDVENYLMKMYPNEQFEISDREEIDIKYYVGEKENTVKGFSYNVKSKTTNVEFKVQNTYEYNSIRHVYGITDNYSAQKTSKGIQ